MKLNEIREKFIKFFINKNHKHIHSSSLIPKHDPTLMFTNSGMVQFKNIFTGLQKSEMKRVVSTQKCLRVGGKHSDLERVGHTTRHHTFFEMLGNFSFGDYFKETAIEFAWKFITEELLLDKDRLSITVYHTDDEAYEIWRKISNFSNDKIVRVETDDNFWSMGDTGPCGPCSEIFYNPAKLDLQNNDRIIEIWNLVFMEFYKDEEGNLQKLSKKCIDTGMGLERITSIMQNVYDNYDIDLFSALINKSQELCGDSENRVAHKIITDHLRAAVFLIAEGIFPGNEGRSYVLRRLIRRAVRYIYLLGYNDSLLHRIFLVLIDDSSPAYMGDVYPELIRDKSLIEITLKSEEENFRDTLMKGVFLLEKFTADLKPGDTLQGEFAFKLYDTYGFPLDITLDILREKKINLDQKGFDDAMTNQKERARAKWIGSGEESIEQIWFDLVDRFGKTEFVGYELDEVKNAKVIAIVSSENQLINFAKEGEKVTILLDRTPFYGESGGQIGDTGSFFTISTSFLSSSQCFFNFKIEPTLETGTMPKKCIITVENTHRINGIHLHRCIVKLGTICNGDIVIANIDKGKRQNLQRNHSATHLLNLVLRKILGDHVIQKGSLISADRLRFDFSHNTQIANEQLFVIEDMVNSLIRENHSTFIEIQSMNQAIDEGAIALFDKEYANQVRVVNIGNSKELCGGTHVKYTGEIGLFKIVRECSIASGIRRIEAFTGQEAINYVRGNEIDLKKVAEFIKSPVGEITGRLSILSQERKRLKSEIKDLYKKIINLENVRSTEINGVVFINYASVEIPVNIIREFILQQRNSKTIIVFTATKKNKTALIIKVSKDLINKISAKKLIPIAKRRDCYGNDELVQIRCDQNETNHIITAIRSKVEDIIKT
ncbi:MAG: alanine--tRNA ligase [Wolbachia endosymbiont of Meromenopon meropis]|nr:alanine--tRNA ligase [Wolbachia endosymbiont of Meromenopon meropis]